MALDTPILFLLFNRPDTTGEVFKEIRKAQPKQLFIAADGPRAHIQNDVEQCRLARQITQEIDWNCRVETLFSEDNRGCGRAVSGAIDWFFENVEEGIIIEDDCVVDQSFFLFCQSMLDHYRDESKVMAISGDNFQDGQWHGEGTYYFSKLAEIWGWATWRRAWQLYDFKMATFPDFREINQIQTFHENPIVQAYFLEIFEATYKGTIDTWDYQWFYTVLKHNGLCVTPNVNLVTNIGFNASATHTRDVEDKGANVARCALPSILHPSSVCAASKADDYVLETIFGITFSPEKLLIQLNQFKKQVSELEVQGQKRTAEINLLQERLSTGQSDRDRLRNHIKDLEEDREKVRLHLMTENSKLQALLALMEDELARKSVLNGQRNIFGKGVIGALLRRAKGAKFRL